MGRQDRDYAKTTAEGRRQFPGSSGAALVSAGSSTRSANPARRPFRLGAGLVILAAGTLLLLGQFPRHHPVVQTLHFTLPSLHHSAASAPNSTPKPRATSPSVAKPHIRRLKVPHFAGINTVLALHGHAPTAGTVTVKGSYNGRRWKTLASATAKNGAYAARIHLSRRGLLHLRVVYPDGSRAVGSIHVG